MASVAPPLTAVGADESDVLSLATLALDDSTKAETVNTLTETVADTSAETVVDYATTAWYVACETQWKLAFALLTRAYDSSDVAALQDHAIARRAVSLLRLSERLQAETTTSKWPTNELLDAVAAAIAESTAGVGVVANLACDVVVKATIRRSGVDALAQWEASLASLLSRATPALKRATTVATTHVATARAFHREYALERRGLSLRRPVAVDGTPFVQQLTHEIQTLGYWTLTNAGDEAMRKAVAAEIEATLRRAPQWRNCQVLLFGSSLNKFGDKASDLDLSLRTVASNHGDSDPTALNQRQAHYRPRAGRLDRRALGSLCERASEGSRRSFTTEQPLPHTKAATKPSSEDVRAAATLLGEHGSYYVTKVLTHTRIPLVRFTHVTSGFGCDLTFGNDVPCLNTLLLRTYAEYDDRARLLGMAVKHWAARRGLNDASRGYLSSYCFIVLVIHFLQHRAGILPNLQHPDLLRLANVPQATINGADVAFCQDVRKARAFHTLQLQSRTLPTLEGSVGSLLLAFFTFYVYEFNAEKRVVTIRSPEGMEQKHTKRDGGLKWRLSIRDPFEATRDLGSVLERPSQEHIWAEMAQARELLRCGYGFQAVVGAAYYT